MGVNSKFSWIFLIAGIIIVAFLLKSFLTAIAFAAVTAFLWHPLHFRFKQKISENLSATIITLVTTFIVIFIVVSGASLVMADFSKIYLFFSKLDIPNKFSSSPEIANTINDVTRFFLSKIIASLSDFVSKIPHVFLSMFIYFITLFFFLKDGERIVKAIKKNIPLDSQKKERIYTDLNNYAHAFINVWLVIGILQAVVAVIGFKLLGLHYGLLAGLAAATLSIMPFMGPSALYIPIGIYLLLTGNTMTGAILMIYGWSLGSFLDYWLRPYLTSKWSNVHPLIILLGIFGGIAALGMSGFIIGPMLLIIVVTLFKDFSLVKELK